VALAAIVRFRPDPNLLVGFGKPILLGGLVVVLNDLLLAQVTEAVECILKCKSILRWVAPIHAALWPILRTELVTSGLCARR
jgi:hypothetical protein